MKFKYVFEAPDDFEKGCCANCPLSIIDWDNDQDLFCALHCNYEECPLEKVKENRKDAEKMNSDKTYELVKTLRKYVTELAKLNHKDSNKIDALYWKYCLSDIAEGLIVIETYIKNGKCE